MNHECLFIGGPCAGRLIGVHPGQYSVRFIGGDGEVEYHRGQIADSTGSRHDVFVLNGLDAIVVLMNFYSINAAKGDDS